MSDQNSDTDLAIHLRAAQQQIQAIKGQPGTNIDLTGLEQSINAALDLHTRATAGGGDPAPADYSSTALGGTPDPEPDAEPAGEPTPDTSGQTQDNPPTT